MTAVQALGMWSASRFLSRLFQYIRRPYSTIPHPSKAFIGRRLATNGSQSVPQINSSIRHPRSAQGISTRALGKVNGRIAATTSSSSCILLNVKLPATVRRYRGDGASSAVQSRRVCVKRRGLTTDRSRRVVFRGFNSFYGNLTKNEAQLPRLTRAYYMRH